MKMNEINVGMRVYHCKYSPYKMNKLGIGTVIEHVSNQSNDDTVFIKKTHGMIGNKYLKMSKGFGV